MGEVITPMRPRQRPAGGACGRLSNRPSAASLSLQLLEGAAQRAFAGFLQVLDDQLVVAARLVQAHAAAGQHLLAVAAA